MIDTIEPIGGFIKDHRTRRRAMTVREMATEAACSRFAVWMVEHGKCVPTEKTAAGLERALKLPPGRLVRHVRLLRTPPDVLALIPAETVQRFLDGL
jgi:ribosome-binding protein aMBF1 (putative translation factor)